MRFISKGVLGALTVTLAVGAVAAPGAFATEAKGQLVNKSGAALVKNKATLRAATNVWLETNVMWTCKSVSGTLTMTSKTAGTLNQELLGCNIDGVCRSGGKEVIPMNNLEVTVVRSVSKTEDLLLVTIPSSKPVEFTCSERKMALRGEYLLSASPQGVLTTFMPVWSKAGGEKGHAEITKYANSAGTEVTIASPLELKWGSAWERALIVGELEFKFEEEAELI